VKGWQLLAVMGLAGCSATIDRDEVLGGPDTPCVEIDKHPVGGEACTKPADCPPAPPCFRAGCDTAGPAVNTCSYSRDPECPICEADAGAEGGGA